MKIVGHMHLLEVIELLRFHKFHLFLECDTHYNEELVRLFYVDVQGKFENFNFRYKTNNKFFKVDSHVWKDLFGMWPQESDAIKIYDSELVPD